MRVGDNLAFYGAYNFDLATSADAISFSPDTPIRVVRWGVVLNTAAVGTTAVLALDHTTYNEAGVAARADGVGGTTLTLPAALAGLVYYTEPLSEVICKPGDILFIDMVTALGTSGLGTPFIQYQKLNWDENSDRAKLSDAAATIIRLIDGTT